VRTTLVAGAATLAAAAAAGRNRRAQADGRSEAVLDAIEESEAAARRSISRKESA
jgi:hypothetical protein